MIDKIYEDFITKLLPKVAEELVITKDYFIDLFGRYIKYLLVSDIFSMVCDIILLVMGIVILKTLWNKAMGAMIKAKIKQESLSRAERYGCDVGLAEKILNAMKYKLHFYHVAFGDEKMKVTNFIGE